MSNRLPDGTIVPSYLSARRTPRAEPSGQFGNVALRIGEVKEIIYPDDERNVSGKVVEYRVAVQQKDRGVGSTVDYPNCIVSNLFGGLGDTLRYTVRASTEIDVDPDTLLGDGSTVLLLCVNGETNRALIVGGFNNENDESENREDGHNLHFNFNGIDVVINKDGEFTLTFAGATDNLGELADGVDDSLSDSNISFTKDGAITLADGSGKQLIQIDHVKKHINIAADAEMDVTCNGNIKMLSAGVWVGAATDAWVLGTTYRNSESQMMKQVSQQLAAAQTAFSAASAALTTAASLMATGPSGNIPAAGPTATAAGSLASAAVAFGVAKAAIDKFEGSADKYLSKKNLTD
jgi:hypothetical protein